MNHNSNLQAPNWGGDGGGGGLPYPFLKIKKKSPDFGGKKALVVSLPRINLPFKMEF